MCYTLARPVVGRMMVKNIFVVSVLGKTCHLHAHVLQNFRCRHGVRDVLALSRHDSPPRIDHVERLRKVRGESAGGAGAAFTSNLGDTATFVKRAAGSDFV
jgi:hypothetical protein